MTVRDVGYHAVQVRGESGASRFTLHNAVLQDTGQQLLKGSAATNGRFADDGLVACSSFSYTTNAPSDYTNGVDLLATKGWVVRDNQFQRIRGPESGGWSSGPAILVWAASEDTIVERNLIVRLDLHPTGRLHGHPRAAGKFNLGASPIQLKPAAGAQRRIETVYQ